MQVDELLMLHKEILAIVAAENKTIQRPDD
jgi:hypothetical protein